MKKRIILTLVLAAGTWTSTGAQAQKERCGTRQPSLEAVDQIEQRISRACKGKRDVTPGQVTRMQAAWAAFRAGE